MLSVSPSTPRRIVALACRRRIIEIAGSEARSFTQIMAEKQAPQPETAAPAKIRKLPYYLAHLIVVVVVVVVSGGGGVCVCVVYFLLFLLLLF